MSGFYPVKPGDQSVASPSHLTLGELIALLEKEDPGRTVLVGFACPHSYRGDYTEVAFEIRENVTVGSMLEAARSALGATFEGWSGGEFTMHEHDGAWLVQEEGDNGETLGSVLLGLMLGRAGS